jgi:hypothetical protein
MVAGSEVLVSVCVTCPSLPEPVPAIPTLMPGMIGWLTMLGTETVTPTGMPGVTAEIGGTMIPETKPCAPVAGT